MEYHKILIRQIPRIMFAHEYKTSNYDLNFLPIEQMVEISHIEQGDVIKTYSTDGKQIHIPAPSVTINFHDRAFSMRSEAPVHTHSTVGFLVDYQLHTITKDQIVVFSREAYTQSQSKFMIVILPDYFEMNQQNTHIEKRIKNIIRTHLSPGNIENIRCTSLLLDLLAEITEECIWNAMADKSMELSPSSVIYVRRAMQYISGHLERKITVEEIAEHLKISCGYLSNLFKNITGQTIIEYVNRVKLDRIKELITSKNVTLKVAGESVGIYDENYISRIFKKYTSLTVREYKMRQ